jgi:hypothetical protein
MTGADSLQRIKNFTDSNIAFYGKDGNVFLANNVPYGFRAEWGGWPTPRWAGAKPYRMMARSLQATAAKYKKVKI